VTSPGNAWAVGSSGGLIGHHQSLILHWNGTAWTREVSPGAAGGVSLIAIAATSARHAWAVGYTGRYKIFIMRWDGHTWRRARTPVPRGEAFLSGVAATSPRNVWVVGTVLTRKNTGLILHWNGTAWTRMPIPHLPVGSFLSTVEATSADNAWAVGFTGGIANKTLILRWNGARWRRVAVPAVTGGLASVTAVSARDAWAVGETVNYFTVGCAGPAARVAAPGDGARLPAAIGGGYAATKLRPLIFHWNGTSWRPVASPALRAGAALFGVTATSAGNAWAVGGLNFLQPNARTVVLRWNGSIWR